jgi:hypothetical protein
VAATSPESSPISLFQNDRIRDAVSRLKLHWRAEAAPSGLIPATDGGGAGGANEGKGRAFGACCFAGKLRSPVGPGPGAKVAEAADPTLVGTLVPTPATRVPTRCLVARSLLVSPLVGPVGRGFCGRLAPLGGVERPRRVVRFARLIQRRDRVLGGPTVRAAVGGNLSLP